MSEFMLTYEETREIRKKQIFLDPYPSADRENFMIGAGAKAQARKLVEWLVKNNIRTEWSEKTDKKWQSLLKELE